MTSKKSVLILIVLAAIVVIAALAMMNKKGDENAMNNENAMPFIVRFSNPTRLAGTSSRTHWPAGGKTPMFRRLIVPSTPHGIWLAPQ